MYEKMAKKVTNLFISKGIINSSDRELYEYSYEVTFLQIAYIIIMIIISLIFGAFYESLAFFVGFSLYRKICGGYHAKTYTRCHFLFAANQTLFLLSLILMPNQICALHRFKDCFCYFCKKEYHWNLDRNCIESVDGFEF